jgi:hypothetical protein
MADSSEMKVVNMLVATDIYALYPYCNERIDGFVCDPRGHKYDCEECKKHFVLILMQILIWAFYKKVK